jgi:hypothetical protein
MMNSQYFAMMAFFVLFLIAVLLYLFPRFGVRAPAAEPFSTIALNTSDFPACLARDYEAQELLSNLKAGLKGFAPSADASMGYAEFALIVQKLLCMDADITSFGAGEYASLRLPFATAHDMEPVGTFVGRCLRNAVKERDISITFDKYRERGNALLATLCHNSASKAKAFTAFDNLVKRTQSNISKVCLKEHASMDIPAGVRDPGYYTPDDLINLGPYQNTAPKYNFN